MAAGNLILRLNKHKIGHFCTTWRDILLKLNKRKRTTFWANAHHHFYRRKLHSYTEKSRKDAFLQQIINTFMHLIKNASKTLQIYIFAVGRSVRVWGLKRPQKTSNVSIFWDHGKVKLGRIPYFSEKVDCMRLWPWKSKYTDSASWIVLLKWILRWCFVIPQFSCLPHPVLK